MLVDKTKLAIVNNSELRELFTFKEETISETHDLLNCKCAGTIQKVAKHIRDRLKVDALESWEHYADVDKIKVRLFQLNIFLANSSFFLASIL